MLLRFDTIPKASTGKAMLDVALQQGRKAVAKVGRVPDRAVLLTLRERERIKAVGSRLTKSLAQIHDAYPSFDQLSEFTRSLFALDMDIDRVRQSLGGLNGIIQTISSLTSEHARRLGVRSSEPDQVTRAYLGRVSSLVRHAEPHLVTLNHARDVFRALPVLDDALFTVAIAGFPNVGKSTLLKHVTGAKAQIRPYAFTTKGLNAGYFEYKYNRIQCIDTPGTLHRDHMNAIEKKADITVRYLAHCIVYVFDPTEGSAPLEEQRSLYEEICSLDKDVLVYVSKTDIAPADAIAALTDALDEAYTDAETLKKAIVKKFRAWA